MLYDIKFWYEQKYLPTKRHGTNFCYKIIYHCITPLQFMEIL